MKTKITKIAVAITAGGALIVGAMFMAGQPKPGLSKVKAIGQSPLLTVDTLASNAKNYSGKTIVLHGVVDRVSAEQGLLTLIDPSEANCTDACQKNSVIVSVPHEFNLSLAKPRTEVVVHGVIENANAPLRFAATQIVSDPADIKKAFTANNPRR